MVSKIGWPKPHTTKSSCEYSLHTREKELAAASSLRTCLYELYSVLKEKTPYVFEFFETYKENNSAFETGVVTTSVYIWKTADIVPLLTKKIGIKNYIRGFILGVTLSFAFMMLVYIYVRIMQ